MQLLLCAFALLAVEPLALDNGAIRVEVDPELFSVRFVGAPGGENFLDPLYVGDAARRSGEWVDPGGLVTDVLPLSERDAVLRRGPAEVLEYDPTHLLLLGPESENNGIRIKKEIRLDAGKPIADYTVSVLSSRTEKQTLSLRNSLRVPVKSTLRTPKEEVTFRSLSGATAEAPVIVKSMRYWQVPIPPTAPTRDTLLLATTILLNQEGRGGTLQRRVRAIDLASEYELDGNLVILIDDKTHSYGAAFQSPRHEVSAATPLVFTERWELNPSGRHGR